MEIKYRKLMEEWGVKLDNPVLDPAFVTKATQFEADLKAGKLTDDQIKATDDELVAMFNQLEKEELDSPELIKEKKKNRILEAKDKIAEAGTLDQIAGYEKEYGDVMPELAAFIEKRKEKIGKATEESQQKQFIADAGKTIAEAAYADLPALAEKYKDYSELIKAINARIEKEKPAPQPETLREKIQKSKKRQWTYKELEAIGIKPTGDDMELEGISFQRQYLYKVYHIIAVDGQKV
jgi:hypothetical protein